ncbi:L-aspartate oxidase [Microaerobacter geothermalis]|uniref:L-aspartate oxidase n=1 Tax=Microaerobacter geothermalis TaxID=674972 RepID=UPI001F395273|nr:L-aspartate oxidase [Microaerobacter geothermalis]MCF6093077.1 L-aspartate oxidase [Microaerobacter geothermalis]
MWKVHKSDLLIIGSGIAGLTLSLIASQYARVTLVTKSKPGEGNSYWAQGGIAGALGRDDDPKFHYEDTIKAGKGLCDEEAVTILVEEAPHAIQFLFQLGVPFDTTEDGDLSLGREGAHSRNRIIHAGGDATGKNIIDSLLKQVKSNPNILLYDGIQILDLMMADGFCQGAVGLSHGMEIQAFQAKITVLANGGLGHLYPYTTNAHGIFGEGYSMAYRAGARLRDLEFIQFHPTALKVNRSPLPLISEAVRGEGAVLVNQLGEPFMEKIHPLKDLASRDIVSQAIYREMKKGRQVFLDARNIKQFSNRFPTIYSSCMAQGIDPEQDLIPVVPAAHYAMGGIETDFYGRSSISGLFALGEVSSTGVHGANRLASNSLLEGIVFAFRAAEAIWDSLTTNCQPHGKIYLPYTIEQLLQVNSLNQQILVKELQNLMWEFVGIVRNGDGLLKAKQQIIDWLKEQGNVPNSYLHQLTTAKLVIEAALWRKESRGAHFREDSPESLIDFKKHFVQGGYHESYSHQSVAGTSTS